MPFIKISLFLWFACSSNCHVYASDFNENILAKYFENLEQSSISNIADFNSGLKTSVRSANGQKNPLRNDQDKLKTSYLLPEYILKKLQILRKDDNSPKSTVGYILKGNIQPEILQKPTGLKNDKEKPIIRLPQPTVSMYKKGNKRAVSSQSKKTVNHGYDDHRRNQPFAVKKGNGKVNKKGKLKDSNIVMTVPPLEFLADDFGSTIDDKESIAAVAESGENAATVKNKGRISSKRDKNKNSKATTSSYSKSLEIDTFTEFITEGGSLTDSVKTLLKNKESKSAAKTKPNVYGTKNKAGTTTVRSQENESAIEQAGGEFTSESPVTMFILEIIGDSSASVDSELVETESLPEPFTIQDYMNDNEVSENELKKLQSVTRQNERTTSLEQIITKDLIPNRAYLPTHALSSFRSEVVAMTSFFRFRQNRLLLMEAEDVTVSYGTSCDFIHNDSCWFEREIGDTLTLGVNINSTKDENSFEVHWKRLYQKYNDKRCSIIKIETAADTKRSFMEQNKVGPVAQRYTSPLLTGNCFVLRNECWWALAWRMYQQVKTPYSSRMRWIL
ncbi:EGF-like domain-containing protein [Nephila pilipes]|uniref:EGF-like domain-containing protein n=1 Tax=Nephila pilipes TaxID=299642 RepID=A0A8X6NZM3_NEPPI|nr:EGF-like domain-containing protein [Nephila pilipes]